jgi:uncharacterized membrane protein
MDGWTLATIVLMALATYLTRTGGYLVLGGRELSSRTMAVAVVCDPRDAVRE